MDQKSYLSNLPIKSTSPGMNIDFTPKEIIKIFQRVIGATPDGIIGKETFKKGMLHFNLTLECAAHFFGQCSYETNTFRSFEENLNYSGLGLMTVFPKYFPTADIAREYARQPERIANRVYANRMGNGPESSGDGWKYRGRGAIQLTGFENYRDFSNSLSNPFLLRNPKIVCRYSFEAAYWYFTKNKLFDIASQGVSDSIIEQITRKVNGGVHGLEARKKKTYEIYKILTN